MAWSLTDLAALEVAIATGATSVQYQDRRVTYRTLREMIYLRYLMRSELGLLEGAVRDIHVVTDKGLD